MTTTGITAAEGADARWQRWQRDYAASSRKTTRQVYVLFLALFIALGAGFAIAVLR